MNRRLTKKQLRRHEGRRTYPYDDATGDPVGPGDCLKGHLTIGTGWNLDVRGLPDDVIERLENEVIDEATTRLQAEGYFHRLNDARKSVCVSMVINLGWGGYKSFKRMRTAIGKDDYEAAADEMLDSRWANQVGRRAKELSEQMRTGRWHESVQNG